MFGAKQRPHRNRAGGPPRLAAMIETPVYDLTNFKVHFGRLTLKAYTKGEHVLRFEAIVHNTKELNCRRGIDMFGEIVTRLAGMAERFCTALDCVDIGFIPDHTLDELPHGVADRRDPGRRHRSEPGPHAQRVGRGPRPGAAPNGFTVTEFAEQVRVVTGQTDGYSTRHASYDLRKIRGKHLVEQTRKDPPISLLPKPPAPSPHCSPCGNRSSHPSSPVSAAPNCGRKPKTWTPIDRDYETLRIDLQNLFTHLGINNINATAA